jgi:formylglycine-generating enzyme required for sulfatase activity
VTLEEARAYVEWLSQKTEERWRLPKTNELRPLARAAPAGNTLNHWAGYDPNPEDAERLREMAQRLPGDAPLLKPAGSFPPHRTHAGTDEATLIFDLGGSAAEWATDGERGGQVVGRSADRSTSTPGGAGEPAPDYVGVRVVRERP